MLKQPTPNMPGIGAMTDTLDFVKNLWGSMGVPGMSIPGMAVPSLSIDDLDKKIADLKAVEAWLNVNLAMLRGTVHALEVQRGTIATLKSMGATLAQAVKQPGADEKSVLAAAPFMSAFFPQATTEPAPAAAAKPAPSAAGKSDASAGASASSSGAEPAEPMPMPNPAMWWNMLQEQFKQAVAASMPPDTNSAAPAQPAPAGGADSAAPDAAKPDAAAPNEAGKPRGAKKTDKL